MRENLAGVAVIFDLDGTLIDTAADLAAAMNHVLSKEGLSPLPPAEVRHLVGHGARAMLQRGFEEHRRAPTPDEMDGHFEVFLAHYYEHIADHSRPFPGVLEAIGRLRAAQAKIAICTNKREAASRLLIEALEIGGLFDAIVGVDTTARPKPDPLPVRHCLDLAGAVRGVFVGDSDTDIKAAAAAGLPCLLAEFGYGPRLLMGEAFARFDDYRSLPDLVFEALECA
ncbi:MAG TPA: HAD-IA family hydrolase [Parvularculaceae bacterium]|nr:HAD-IA family hydrolase [Parvularculaceae bacterium]